MPKKDGSISDQLKRVGVRLKRWRAAHAAKRRLPDELWAAAVQVAGEEGIYRTSRTLHLDYGNLKRKVEASTNGLRAAVNRAPANRGAQPGAFMELLAGSMGGDCLIELEEAGRGRMRIQIKLTAPDVISLVREWRVGAVEFWERQS